MLGISGREVKKREQVHCPRTVMFRAAWERRDHDSMRRGAASLVEQEDFPADHTLSGKD